MTRTSIARVVIAAGLFLATSAWGLDPEQIAKIPPAERAAIQTEFMAKKLSLTADEKTKISAVNVKYADQMQGVLTGQMGPLERMRDVKRLEEGKDAELQTMLTPAQYKTYQASKDELKKKMEERATAGN